MYCYALSFLCAMCACVLREREGLPGLTGRHVVNGNKILQVAIDGCLIEGESREWPIMVWVNDLLFYGRPGGRM